MKKIITIVNGEKYTLDLSLLEAAILTLLSRNNIVLPDDDIKDENIIPHRILRHALEIVVPRSSSRHVRLQQKTANIYRMQRGLYYPVLVRRIAALLLSEEAVVIKE